MTKRVAMWWLVHIAFAALVWFGVVREEPGPLNVVRLWVGMECALTVFCFLALTVTNAKELDYPATPKWMDAVRPWTQTLFLFVFAWCGHIPMAVAYAVACLAWAAVKQRIARAQGITP